MKTMRMIMIMIIILRSAQMDATILKKVMNEGSLKIN